MSKKLVSTEKIFFNDWIYGIDIFEDGVKIPFMRVNEEFRLSEIDKEHEYVLDRSTISWKKEKISDDRLRNL